MREIHWKKLIGAASAAVLAATQVAPTISAFAEEASTGDYVYCYATMTWAEYWKNEGVYLDSAANGNWEASSAESDAHNETDMGAFDAVTRATSNHGLHRGSYQCAVKVFDTDGNSYDYTGKGQGESVDVVKNKETGTADITVDGTVVGTYDHSVISGPKYVPVAVPAADYEDFKKAYTVYENGTELTGGYSEGNLVNIDETVKVDANTSGIKTAEKQEDGTFQFSKRETAATADGKVVDTSAVEIGEVQHDSGYGDFIRVDINGDYGDLGAHMYAVRWDYYGDGDTVLATYGTKFAADNWMHKAMGIQLGLTDSYRCQLPKGTDGTGKWKITVYAMGYADTVFEVNATDANIVKPEAGEADTTALKAAVEKAEALKEADYTADSWKAMQLELQEAKDLLAKEKPTQAEVDEATTHLNAAVEALVKADTKVTVTLNKKTATVYKGKTTTLKATVTGADAPKVTFTSSNPKVAAVNKTTGKVTAKAKGSAVITVKCGDVKVTCKVTVKNPTLTLNKTSASVKVGKTTKITAKATPSGKVTYKSGNKKIATVSSNGTIKGIKKGTAKITVTCNGVTKTVKVTVK